MGDPLRLYGLKALVTNAGSGIGEAVSRTLVKHGATVLAVDSPASGVEQLFARVRGVDGYTAALSGPADLAALVEAGAGRLGGIDILVNDLPTAVDAPLVDGDNVLDGLLQRRKEFLTAISDAALPYLEKSPAGRIVTIGFLRSMFAKNGSSSFAKAEQDLAAFTRALAARTGQHGITANYVQPGAIMTPVSRETFSKDKALRDFCISRSAARRLGEPVDVAKVVLFLASDDAVFVSGTGITVDGGKLAG